ncbi:alpha-mannosidase [Paenilisteria rocourtiae]|uniref:Alpha-mannosidase n=1 Tax=Listeria rocourtiae TaxID=647910 RepID=A0A4R6ZQ51_9LIST|nr:alpha-mannosidase [Listeria rocourtiae]MBC1604213.1 alpha-mannosidase [Listeria rocourtiae]TDR54717.1 alpha-mannosidase [Listeria rocourtiae]
MFWTKEKVQNRNGELSQYRYVISELISDFDIMEDSLGAIGSYPTGLNFKEKIALGENWCGRDRYVWLRASVVLPAKREGHRILGFFDFGKTGDGNNSGFESLLFMNGEPYQGVDQNHKEVFFSDDLAGTRVELIFRLWSGLEGGGQVSAQEHRIKEAFIGYLDVAVDDLYYTAFATLQTLDYLAENSTERYGLMQALDHSFRVIDWANPGSAEHVASLHEAGRLLNLKIDAMPKNFDVTVTCVGHTHIDVAWLWRLKHTREKSARSFSTVMRLMEQYPNYEFLQSQPQLYAYIKEDYPDIYAKMKARVADGRWEADGGMWLEADCNIPSGESLVRQILQGTRFFKEEFGKNSKFLWLPDVFGYSWALPQILKKSGLETFMTTKISWNQFNKMPHDTFWWRGIDGSEILTHFITTPDNAHDIYYTYNGNITARAVKGVWDSYNDKNLNNELLVSYGFGDGGGGPTREMLEMIDRFDKMPGMPKVETGLAGPYFERLHERVENSEEYVHTWNGELYFEYHRGTYTSQAHNKKMNRKLELLLRDAEWFQVLQIAQTGDFEAYPSDLLRESWRIVLRNQFHDIIPGSSIQEVYEDCVVEYDEAENLALMAYDEMSAMDENTLNCVTLMNSSIWERPRLAEIAIPTLETVIWKDAVGKRLDAERNLAGSWLVALDGLTSFGTETLTYEVTAENTEVKPLAQVVHNGLETNRYRVTWNEAGQFTQIFDKRHAREVLAKNEAGNVLQVFEDKPLNFDAWDIDIYYQEKMREVTQLESVAVTQNGELQATVRMEWLYGSSTIAQNIHFYRDSARIDFETEIDWHEKQQLLKVAFPVDVMASEATYDIQYGNVKRPTHWNTSWDYARFETVGHQWADLSETGYGVSILNNCKYGHDIKDHVMRLTLLKSAIYPDVTQDQGEHMFTYALLPHKGDFVEGDVVQEAWALNNPLRAALGSHDNRSLLRSNHEQIQIDAVKKAEDDDAIIVRLHEFTGGRCHVVLTSDFQIESWQECDLMERPIAEKETGRWSFSVTPYEVKTFKIQLK